MLRRAVLLLAALVALTACGGGHQSPQAAATIKCGLLACSHGEVGEPCTIAGYPGKIVQVSAHKLGCNPSPGPMSPAATAAPPPPPSPQPTTLQISAVMGWDITYITSRPDRFVPGPDPYPDRNTLPSNVLSDIPACGVTVTNQNSVLVNVSHVEIAYYDAAGNEISTATPGLPVVGVGPGNTVTTMDSPPPDNAVSCSALGWSP